MSRPGAWSSPAERLLSAGYELLAVDVLGQGELRTTDVDFDKVRLASERAHAGFTYGYNLPLPSERVQDVLTAIRFARSRAGKDGRVLLVGTGPAAAWAAGARALAIAEVDRAALDVDGYRFHAADRIDSPDFLPGAVKYGDVPALVALSAPGDVWVRDRQGGQTELDLVRRAYSLESTRLTLAGPDSSLEDAVSWAIGIRNEK
jgi:hypothetical protein